ncbi:MAG: bacteriocin-protection protein, partial [Actinobacteria bacterium]
MKPTFFATSEEFRAWLEQHHDTATELWVGLYKKRSGRPSITWPEAVDEALCFGWIDSVR